MNKILSDIGFYKASQIYKDGVCCILFTLNNESDVVGCLESLRMSKIDQLLLVDGRSSDKTIALANTYVDKVIVTSPGIINQAREAIKKCEYKYLVACEADHRYPVNFVEDVINKLKASDYSAIQPILRCSCVNNFFEKGLSREYELSQPKPGPREIIGGPLVTYSEIYSEFLLKSSADASSGDTEFCELLRSYNHQLALVEPVVEQYEIFGFKTWFAKYFWYGQGDYSFYSNHSKNWNLYRKLRSISHPFRKYIYGYFLKEIINFNFSNAFYFLLTCLVRYIGWFVSIFRFGVKL